ncbi:MAG: ATP-dependent zinc metalloprotease FtsH [Chloroflexi bacterium ADurb.Bin325]|nr:MAG: ATP-dependent zinc metalloprotease FtsH [Chloroflexi bacterium ADurb.Bin325]
MMLDAIANADERTSSRWPAEDWTQANQRWLAAALAGVRAALERYIGGQEREPAEDLTALAAGMPAPPALDTLANTFGLSSFERSLLLLCAGVELDSRYPALCAAAQQDPARSYATFSLALAALADAHWSALAADGPLRYWRLIEVGPGSALTTSPLRIDERVLHYLLGVQNARGGLPDERLAGFVRPADDLDREELAASQRDLAGQIVAAWAPGGEARRLPAVQLCGEDGAGQRAIALAACEQLGLALHVLPALVLPLEPREHEALARLWTREAALSQSALLLDCGELEPADASREAAVGRFIEAAGSPLFIAGRERRTWPTAGWRGRRPLLTLEVRAPTPPEQRDLWERGLGDAAIGLDGSLDALVDHFNLPAPAIRAACIQALSRAASQPRPGRGPAEIEAALWEACRVQARPRLANLAQHIAPAAAWDDLVLPETQRQILREIAVHVRQRAKVYETWGFAAKSARGLGISALFAGGSGTGKTMAAEVLANELDLDLFRIDLSQVVSKYIGETEKNLRRVFDAAEGGGAILLFDEADALFGKRSEVKDSHDRYANIEISYLLQRMEGYRGLAILTTNMRDALDPAFLRRIRFVVQFPFPDAAQRAEIWRRIFPADTPTEGLDVARLARLNIAGGNIRNIAIYAAFLAADAHEPVRMGHLLRAARVEYAKLERPLSEAEIGGWG